MKESKLGKQREERKRVFELVKYLRNGHSYQEASKKFQRTEEELQYDMEVLLPNYYPKEQYKQLYAFVESVDGKLHRPMDELFRRELRMEEIEACAKEILDQGLPVHKVARNHFIAGRNLMVAFRTLPDDLKKELFKKIEEQEEQKAEKRQAK